MNIENQLLYMANKKTTIEDLARMINKGFDGTATKNQVDDLEVWAKNRFDGVDRELKAIRKQLVGVVYRHEFEELETRVKELENLLALPSKK